MSRSATRRWLKKKNCGQVADEFAEGQIVLSLEGGYNCEVTAECGVECVKVCAWVGGCACVFVCVCVCVCVEYVTTAECDVERVMRHALSCSLFSMSHALSCSFFLLLSSPSQYALTSVHLLPGRGDLIEPQ